MSFNWGHWIPPDGHDCIPKDALGFLYKIINKENGKYYIGIKQITRKVRKKPLKGKKRNRISIAESDWRKYCSSSGEISEDIDRKSVV
jgi:hypothetical protein